MWIHGNTQDDENMNSNMIAKWLATKPYEENWSGLSANPVHIMLENITHESYSFWKWYKSGEKFEYEKKNITHIYAQNRYIIFHKMILPEYGSWIMIQILSKSEYE